MKPFLAELLGTALLVLLGNGADDAILVAGSLYVVGAARPYLKRILP